MDLSLLSASYNVKIRPSEVICKLRTGKRVDRLLLALCSIYLEAHCLYAFVSASKGANIMHARKCRTDHYYRPPCIRLSDFFCYT